MSDPLQFAQSEIVKATEAYERAVIERNEVELVRDKLYDILRRTAIALKGPEGLQCHSFHDLPEVAQKLLRDIPEPWHVFEEREPNREEVMLVFSPEFGYQTMMWENKPSLRAAAWRKVTHWRPFQKLPPIKP